MSQRRRVMLAVAIVAAAYALVLAAGCARSDAATTEAVLQDDQACVYGWHGHEAREEMLSRWRDLGGTHIRVIIQHAVGAAATGLAGDARLEQYDDCIAAIAAHGLVPQLTLDWTRQPDPRAAASWMADMTAHFAPLGVRRFAVENEPDRWIEVGDACTPDRIAEFERSTAYRALASTTTRVVRQRVRYRGRVRQRLSSISRPKWVGSVAGRRVALTRVGRRYYRTALRRVTATRTDQVGEDTSVARYRLTPRSGCLAQRRGEAYRQIALAAVPAMRAAAGVPIDVGVGESSPLAGAELFAQAVGDTGADAWHHHCYRYGPFAGPGAMRSASGLPVRCTEAGVLQEVEPMTGAPAAAVVAQRWRADVREGATEVAQYQAYRAANGNPWDTSVQSLGGWDALRPAFEAVR